MTDAGAPTEQRVPATMVGPRHGSLALQSWTIAIALMPLAFATSIPLKFIPFAVLFFSGIYLLCSDPLVRASVWHARWPLLAMLGTTLYAIVNVWIHGIGSRPLDLPLQTVMFLVIAAVFAVRLNQQLVWCAFSITGMILGIVAVVQYHFLQQPRAYGLNGGAWAAVEFGMFLLVLALLSLSRLLSCNACRRERWLHALAIVLAGYGALLSESRGPVLSGVLVLAALGGLEFARCRSGNARGRQRWLWAGALMAVVLALLPETRMASRLDRAHEEVSAYVHGAEVKGAVSERLEMWQVSWRAFAEHPALGVGIGQFGEYVRKQVRAGLAAPSIYKYENPHSEYMEAAATGGGIGLMLLLLQFCVPVVYFARGVLTATGSAEMVARAGYCVALMYPLCAVTNNVFYRAMPNSLYFFLVAGLAVNLACLRSDPGMEVGGGRSGLD